MTALSFDNPLSNKQNKTMASSIYTGWFSTENRDTGMCLWTALETFLPFTNGGVSNQPQTKAYDKNADQKIEMEWDDFSDPEKRDPLLPCNFFRYGISVTIDKDKRPLSHEVIFKLTKCSKRQDLVTTTHYRVPTVRHMKRLAELLASGRMDVLALLEEVDWEEYILSRLQKEMGMPKPVDWSALQ